MADVKSVDHPAHYGGKNNPYEAIKVIEAHDLNFNLGNVVKYVIRASIGKDDSLEDLKKANWYVLREIERRLRTAREEAASGGREQV